MAGTVTLPLTGTGDVTVKVAVEGDTTFGEVQLVGFAVQSPHDQILSQVNLSAGANVDLTAAVITAGKMGRLLGADIGCSVAMRCDIQVVSGARVTRTTVYTQPGETKPWRVPMGGKWIELAGGGSNAFGVSITNLDVNQAADVRTTLFWDEVTP